MKKSSNFNLQRGPSWWRSLWLTARLCWSLLADSRVAFFLKLIPVAALIYFLSPYDLLPDLMIPGLGQLDDLLLLVLAGRIFLYLVPADIVREHQERIYRS